MSNKTGGSLYKKSTFDVENGKTYKAYVSGSKIQIYYLEFVAEQGESESTTEGTTEFTTETTTQSPVEWPATEDATYWDFSTDKYAEGAPAGDDNGLIIGEKMSPKNSSVDGKYVQVLLIQLLETEFQVLVRIMPSLPQQTVHFM